MQAAAAPENIQVVLRVRPLSEAERSRGDKKVVQLLQDGKRVQLKSSSKEDFGQSLGVKTFVFDSCVDEDADQATFYDKCGAWRLAQKALDGYSATLFAYGQTGSGKTYSISGAEDVINDDQYHGGDPREGLIPRTARQLWAEVEGRGRERKYSVKAACFEIYNEQVLDLLNPDAGNLQIRESRAQGFYIENLLVVECQGASDLQEVFKEGTRNRHVGEHKLNRDSSRSHSALVIYVDSVRMDEETGEEVRQYGKLTFVDLAGSERLKYSGSSGEMTKETGSINRSLFTLGKVIAILSRGETFVPYRDSKLTKLLMDSLGGSSSCVMVACCSPSGRFVDETLSTLQYASKAKNICNKPILQLDPSQRLIQQLRTEIQGLRAENMQLRMQQGIPAGEKILTSSMAMLRVQQEEEAAKEAGRRREVQSNPGSPGGEDTFSRASSLSHRSSKMLNGTGGGDLLYEKAVGYAEGYAAGLDQAREVLSSGALDFNNSLAPYDLFHKANGPSRAPTRLPPLPAGHPDGHGMQQGSNPFTPRQDELASQQALENTCSELRAECLRLQEQLDMQVGRVCHERR